MRFQAAFVRVVLVSAVLPAAPAVTLPLLAQATATGTSALQSSVGTVKTVGNGTLSLSTDKGDTVNVTLPANVRVLQLAPGSTDLKTAQPATVTDIAEGDRVLVSARADDTGAFTALRVVLMKSVAIAQNNASRQQDWQRRGAGGVVNAVDGSAHTLTVSAGTRKETVTTTSSTIFRRYAPGSVKFEEAKQSKLEDIRPGDQVRVRGDKSADGASIAADEVVSGEFRSVAGLLTKVDASANTLTLNDLATKKPVTVAIAGDSDLRNLPPEMAARFAARVRGGTAAQGSAAAATQGGGAGAGGGRPASAAATGSGNAGADSTSGPARSGQRGPGSAGDPAAGGYGAGRGGDLSQVIPRLPKTSLAELKPGQAVMVVASGDSAAGSSLTAITLLSGVEPLLAASPQGGANGFSISPWSLGGGGEGGGEGGGPQ